MKVAERKAERNPLAGIKKTHLAGFLRDSAMKPGIGETLGVTERPPGERFLYWLGLSCRRAREEAGIKPAAIATKLGRREAVVDNFEKGINMPRELETMLASYAELTGKNDARDLITDALRDWYANGEAPGLTSPDEAKAVASGSSRRTRRPPIEPTRPGKAGPRKKAAGSG